MPMPGMMNKVPSGPAPVNRPVISASAVATSNNVRPQAVSSFNNFASNGNRPTVTATAAVSSVSNGRPVSPQVAAASFNGQQTNPFFIPSSPASQRPQQQPVGPPAYQPPSQSYLPPPPAQKPNPSHQVTHVQQPARPAYQQQTNNFANQPTYQASQSQQTK